MNREALAVLVVLFSTLAAACATTTMRQYKAPPAAPLTADEIASLTPEEQKEVDNYRGTSPYYFPEAVVYTDMTYSENTKYRAYEKAGEKPAEGGGTEMPMIAVSVKRSSGRTGPRVLWATESAEFCIPDTKDCSSYFKRTAVVFRQSPVKIAEDDIPYQFRASFSLAGREKGVAMLDITKQEIDLIISASKQLRDKEKLGDDCRTFQIDGFVSFRDDPLREKVIAALTSPTDYYLTYQQATGMYHELAEYSFALAGCYDGEPNNQKGEKIARGEEIVKAVLGPLN